MKEYTISFKQLEMFYHAVVDCYAKNLNEYKRALEFYGREDDTVVMICKRDYIVALDALIEIEKLMGLECSYTVKEREALG
jgi:hypothetical protein